MLPRRGKLATLLWAALLAAGSSRAQAPPGRLPPKPGVPIQQPQERPPTIRVKVELVNTPVTVRDSTGELVLDLAQRDFRVFDNGAEQRIEHFDLGGDPLSVVLVVETSSRIESLLPAVRRTGILFTQIVLGPTGEAAVLGFNDSVDKLLPFSSDADEIEKSVSSLRLGTSGARLYDALSEAVGLLRNRPSSRRRVIVAVSEAVDSGSETKLGQVLREAQLANVTIYAVGLSTTAAELRNPPKQSGPHPISPPGTFTLPPMSGTPQTPTTEQLRYGNIDLLALVVWMVQRAANAVGQNSLELAAVATGGLSLSTFRDRSIEKALDQIGGELHAQYLLSYRPAGTDPSGYHEIKVEVTRPGVKVRSRPGYYVAPPES
ncbi:MAG TPA: VWA domain-containing protein [Candidatus Acidoferrales bacterium]|nr:VWA domain-containing protein [Candidatus Acidoferrales bacterium]